MPITRSSSGAADVWPASSKKRMQMSPTAPRALRSASLAVKTLPLSRSRRDGSIAPMPMSASVRVSKRASAWRRTGRSRGRPAAARSRHPAPAWRSPSPGELREPRGQARGATHRGRRPRRRHLHDRACRPGVGRHASTAASNVELHDETADRRQGRHRGSRDGRRRGAPGAPRRPTTTSSSEAVTGFAIAPPGRRAPSGGGTMSAHDAHPSACFSSRETRACDRPSCSAIALRPIRAGYMRATRRQRARARRS